ncbi:MAG: putative peptidoglycan glycosyltransferase FtsW [Anaerolineae bacterium]|nr:putative peptidoglycan glycosyltransferase FtsW [Anaerolineae bacterium]
MAPARQRRHKTTKHHSVAQATAPRAAPRRGRKPTPAVALGRRPLFTVGPVTVYLTDEVALLGVVAALIGLGLVMVFSASYVYANLQLGASDYYLSRQLLWLGVGTVALVTAALVDYRKVQGLAVLGMAATMVMLLLVLMTGERQLGSVRHLSGGSIQPSELAKLTVTFYIAAWLISKGERLRQTSYGMIPFAVLMGLVAVLIVAQPDFDTTAVILVTGLTMFFVAGAELKQLAVAGVGSAAILALVLSRVPYATQRINDYLASLRDPLGGSDHMRQLLEALGRGGFFGRGLGNGLAKEFGRLPLPWTDSIFVVIGEELGLLGALSVVALFVALGFLGLRIAFRAQDPFGKVLGVGLTTWLTFQAFLNMAANTAILPLSGLTLPFISYGGSSLVTCMAAVGVLLSIARYGTQSSASGQSRDSRPADDWLGLAPTAPEARRVRRRHGWPRLPDLGRSGGARPRPGGRGLGVKASSAVRVRLVRVRRSLARRPAARPARRRVPRRR